MALETERSSPSSASSPGPTTTSSPSSSGTTYTKSISPVLDIKPAIIHHPLAIYPSTFQPAILLPPRLSPRRDEPAVIINEAALRFSVSNILKPEFGRRAVDESRLRAHIESARSKSSRCSSGDDCRSFTSSPLLQRPPSPRKLSHHEIDSDRHSGNESSIGSSSRPSSSLEEKLADPQAAKKNSLWPAWVYCTRYSDRPSSGENKKKKKNIYFGTGVGKKGCAMKSTRMTTC
jgi:hypothetical protein